jgi:hypothetical protein
MEESYDFLLKTIESQNKRYIENETNYETYVQGIIKKIHGAQGEAKKKSKRSHEDAKNYYDRKGSEVKLKREI